MTTLLSPPNTIQNPLRSGDYTMNGGSYLGDVGSIDRNVPTVLRLANGAFVRASVGGIYGDPPGIEGAAKYAYFEISGNNSLTLTQIGGGRGSPIGPGFVNVVLDPGAILRDGGNTDTAGFASFHTTIDCSGALEERGLFLSGSVAPRGGRACEAKA